MANAILSTSVYNPPSATMAALPTTATPAANTAATHALAPAQAKDSMAAGGVAWSYSAAPTGGNLQVSDGTNVVLNVDIIAGGPGSILFSPIALRSTIGKTLTATLAAGGAGIYGKVCFLPGGEV